VIPPSGETPNAEGGGGRGGRGAGPVVLPGRYTVAVGSLKRDVTVEPDPHFTITDADRAKRHAAILAAYSIQRQLVPAREAARTLAGQLAALRQYFSALGDSGKASLAAIDKVTPEIARAQAQIERAIASAAQAQNAMDGYNGLPTAAQLRQVDWAWEDATASAKALNQLIAESVPAAYASMGGAVRPPRLDPVAVPVR
jgi:cell division protein ZapA (FtsZ GTPase activity inhibitor)